MPTTIAAVTAITDNVGIFQGTVARGATTDDTSLSISGTLFAVLAAGETVRIYDGTSFLGTATVTGTSWSYADSRTLTEKQRVSYTAQVADAAGNQSAAGRAYTATVDLTAPITVAKSEIIAEVTAITDNVGIFQGTVASGATTDDTSLSISGTLPTGLANGETVRIYDGTSFLGTAAVSGTSWSYTDRRMLTDNQSVSYTAQVADAAGNQSAAGSAYTATVDLTAPITVGNSEITAAVTAITDNVGIFQGTVVSAATTDDTSLSIRGTLSSALATDETVRIYDGTSFLGTAAVSGTSWSYADSRTLTDNQSVSYTAQVADAAGNQSAAGSAYTATVDLTAPSTIAAVTAITDNVGIFQGKFASGATTDDTSLSISGTLSAGLASGETVRIYDGTSFLGSATVTGTSWSYADSRTLSDQMSVSYTAQVSDAARNQSAAGRAYTATVDLAAPTTIAAVTAITDNVGIFQGTVASGATTDDTSLSISGTLTAVLAAGETVRIYDGTSFLGTAAVSGTSWSYADSRTLSDQMSVSYTAQVSDAAGNQSAAGKAYTATVDLSAPTLVADINPGSADSYSLNDFTAFGNTLFFSAFDGTSGTELWKTDGTTTSRVADIYPGSSGSIPFSLAAFGNNVFFSARDGTNDRELWKTDGTTTSRVADINPGNYSSHPGSLTVVGNTLYFSAYDSVGISFGSHLFPTAGTPFPSDNELWKTDGTTTSRVADINPGTPTGPGYPILPNFDSNPKKLTAVGNTLYFSANDGTSGTELWKTDGTTTSRVADINPGNYSSNPGSLTVVGNTLYFSANDGTGYQSWETDGTTTRLADTTRLVSSVVTAAGKTFFFVASDGIHGNKLLNSDLSVKSAAAVGNTLFFEVVDSSSVYELWKTDGTTTSLVADTGLTYVSPELAYFISQPPRPLAVGNTVFYQAYDGSSGIELWKTDGTTTSLVADINPGSASSNPDRLTAVGNRLFFTANDGSHGNELWTFDLGPISVAAVTAITDNVGIFQGKFASGATTDDTSLSISGTLTAVLAVGETVRIYDGTSFLGTAAVSGTSWSYIDSRTLSDNQSVSYTAQVSDAAGNQSAAGSAYTATVDLTAPTTIAAVTAIIDNVGIFQGTVASGATTDDTSLSIGGTLSAGLANGETVRIYDGTSFLGTAAVSGTSWSYADSFTLTNNNSVSYTAQVADAAGNQSAASAYTATVDLTAPSTTAAVTAITDNVGIFKGAVASGATTDDISLSIGGTLSAGLANGETVRIYDGTSFLGTAAVSGKSWSYADSRTLADNQSVIYTAQVADAAGNQSAASAYTATVDLTAPTTIAAITGVTDNVGLFQGIVAAAGRTDDLTPTITGTLTAALVSGETLRISNGSVFLSNATVNNTAKTWSYTPTLPATAGTSYSITVRVADAAGNLGVASVARTFTLDTTAPTTSAAITAVTDNVGLIQGAVANGGRTDDLSPTITGTLTAALVSGGTLRISNGSVFLGNATVNNTTKTWAYTPTLPATVGTSYSITARVADAAGNLGVASVARTFTLDTTAPLTTAAITGVTDNVGLIQGIVAAAGLTDDLTPTITGTLSAALAAGETLRVFNGAALLGSATVNKTTKTWSFIPTLPASAGTAYSITARVADAAANLGVASAARTFTLDTTAPSVVSFSPLDGASGFDPAANISLSFSEAIQRGSGAIQLRTGSATGPITESFDAATSTRLSLSGTGLTINPTSNLAPNTSYFLTMPAGSLRDAVGNPFAGTSTYDFRTTNVVSGTPAANDILPFTSTVDRLTGLAGADTFRLTSLSLARLPASPTTPIDRITDFAAGLDTFDAPVARTLATALNPTALGAVSDLSAAAIGAVLTPASFPALTSNSIGGAATFTFGTRTFLAINDGVAGFSAATDSILEITGVSGNLGQLQIY